MSTDLGTVDVLTAEHRRQLLERVHHEIRTPLTALLGHLELLEDADVELPYRLEISLGVVSRSGQRLRELLAELDTSVGGVPVR